MTGDILCWFCGQQGRISYTTPGGRAYMRCDKCDVGWAARPLEPR